jgi:hypothetical protein
MGQERAAKVGRFSIPQKGFFQRNTAMRGGRGIGALEEGRIPHFHAVNFAKRSIVAWAFPLRIP